MIFHQAKPLSVAALVALTACGGGGGGGDTGGGGGDPTPGSNGLPFGAVGQTLLIDAVDRPITMRSASFQAGSAPSIVPATITVDAGFFQGGTANLNGTITIFGETVTIENGQGTLDDSDEVVVVTFEPNRPSAENPAIYTAALEVNVSGQGFNDVNGEAAYVFGFETEPDTIAARTGGTLTYVGDFQSFGSLGGANNAQTEYAGGITVAVNFAGSGNAIVTLDGQIGGTGNVDMAGNIGLTGNGFAGELNCTTGCTGAASEVDATFYGPNANELGGVLAIDITATDFGTYDGVGTFILTNPTAN
ncbi:transferrin-binding protein-like solute binding protein [Yoonia algicola]|uniref:Transferrin-binding protein-like solute binding protein n=1 Tax=Yoonia algicola TaxID=3137368 RepID=A0AAN0NHS4_9RHOB